MKRYIPLLFGAQVLLTSFPAIGQTAGTCQNPVGSWKNGAQSVLNIVALDSVTGEIKGSFQLSATEPASPVSGWIDLSRLESGNGDVIPISFATGRLPTGGIESWTGYCRELTGAPAITVLWQKVHTLADSPREQIESGADVFSPVPAAGPVHADHAEMVRAEAHVARASTCPNQGKSKNGNPPSAKITALNLLKNRHSAPKSSDMDGSVTLSQMLNSHDDPSVFDQEQGAAITGVLFDVRREKGESCNCYSTDSSDWDYHIYISNGKAKSIFDCAVVEMTPFSRSIHPEWTFNFVKGLKGKKVKVTGWLLFDFEHTGQSFGTNPNTGAPNRHTVWEIHPVTGVTPL
jgi:hypothetical protein